MNFLEKNLEDIISENYEACEARGLRINQAFYKHGKQFRQLNLAPYGIADLVNIRFFAPANTYYVQVIELKKGKVDTAAYFQAKRYQTAIASALRQSIRRAGIEAGISVATVLVGNELEKAGDFVFGLNGDVTCDAFLYAYAFDGISFSEVGREWVMTNSAGATALELLGTEMNEHRVEAQEAHEFHLLLDTEARREEMLEYGDYSQALIITPTGIKVNPEILEASGIAEEEEEEDGAE